ncbi:MAG TPA: TnsA endonuclease N-terminal domain-containing protein [Azonexus sp.]|nr:TnsA endonuclease N-terminal domain-containing protein [Azonexus sp.]
MKYQVDIKFAEKERARRVISRSNSRVTGKYPGLKSRRMHYWESSLERDAFMLLDVSTEVISFDEQPVTLYYGIGKKLRHYPDVLVSYPNRQVFVEIKTDQEALTKEIVTRTAYLVPALARHGYGYRIWTESQIRDRSFRLANLRFLLRFGRSEVELTRFEWLRLQFKKNPLQWKQVVGHPTDKSKLAALCRLILEGRLRIDLMRPIFPESLVYVERM